MRNNPIIRYVGFKVKTLVREYTFTVRDAESEREFTLNIANDAFVSHRARYQDAPAICSVRLNAELAAHSNHPPDSDFAITASDLETYRKARTPATAGLYGRKPKGDF